MKIIESIKSIFSRIKNFYEEVVTEMKTVTWPSKNEVWYTTIVVIIAAFICGIYLFLIDLFLTFVLDNLYKLFT